ncbi:galectin-10-like [Monodelphis domestica]|uniref:Galectin n=1 Tax=Monodelphis domestica TaxID=13616 RepID=F6QPN6_MONDO|nr:galectin-10-like [Monodelphis domestica]
MAGNLPVPYKQPIYLPIGCKVKIVGKLSASAASFQVEFYSGTTEDSNIAFRFLVIPDGYVTMNSYEEGEWKQEEQLRFMPFSKGQPFDLQFVMMPDKYQVIVNGKPSFQFEHRLPLQTVQMFGIEGDVKLYEVTYYS